MDSEEDRDFRRRYGQWATVAPAQVAEMLAGVGVPWWIVGGWAIDAVTGEPREHEDIDVGCFRSDLPLLLELAPAHCVWSNLSGTLRPLRRPDDLLPDCRQLWVRRAGDSPWLVRALTLMHPGHLWLERLDGVSAPS